MAQTLTKNLVRVWINDKEYTNYMQMPYKFSNLLDEQLDEASLTLVGCEDKIFKPFTKVKIEIENGVKTISQDMFVATDKADEIPTGSGKYKHELYLIELTKFLECFVVRSIGFKNSLKNRVESTMIKPVATKSFGIDNVEGINSPIIISPSVVGLTFALPSPTQFIDTSKGFSIIDNLTAISIGIDGETIFNYDYGEHNADINTIPEYIPEMPGTYTIKYKIWFTNGDSLSLDNCYYFTYEIDVLDKSIREWNARTVLRRVLAVAETLRQGENPRFAIEGDIPYYENGNPIEFLGEFETLADLRTSIPYTNIGYLAWVNNFYEGMGATCKFTNNGWGVDSGAYPLFGIAKELQKIETPEFQFTQSTLREVLQEVGRFIHAEPRLTTDINGNYLITYDKLGSGEISDFNETNYASLSLQQGVDRYATNLYSTVNNFANSIDYANGVIVEPYAGGVKSVRTEDTYTRLESTNVFISTDFPIRSVVKLEYGEYNSVLSRYTYYDITEFVYEFADYQRLSSYDGLWYNNKAWALYYNIGQNNINGLNEKQSTPFFQEFQQRAIVNIIRFVTGDQNKIVDFATTSFRVTYEPIYSATVQQSKSCIVGLDTPATMVYNQGQNMVESHYFGENMKGAIARLGNVDKVLTFVKNGLAYPPKVGEIILDGTDEYYISAVASEIYPYYTKFSISLSKDFNRYSDYIKINSEKRMYEISERQAFDSHITYRDYIVFGDLDEEKVYNDGLFNKDVIGGLFEGSNIEPLTLSILQGVDKLGNELNQVCLPIQRSAVGNSVVFTIKYKDNYSAGDRVAKEDLNYYQNGVAYSDMYGNMEYLRLELYSGTRYTANNGASLPLVTQDLIDEIQGQPYISTDISHLWIKKGSTEIPTIDYQIDFVTNRPNFIVGSALAKNLPFVQQLTNDHKAVLVVLDKRLNKFERVVNDGTIINDAFTLVGGNVLGEEFGYYDVEGNSNVEIPSSKAWALIDKETKEILIGCNKEVSSINEIFDGWKIYIKHDIYK